MPENRNRPAGNRAAQDVTGGRQTQNTRRNALGGLSATLLVDLSTEPDVLADEAHDRRQLAQLEHAPDGARVTVTIGDRIYYSYDVIRILHDQSARLWVDLVGPDAAVLRAWMNAIRAGKNPVIL